MVFYWLKIASIACLWVETLARLPHAVRHREQRALWAAVAMIAVVLTLYMKNVSDALGTVAPSYVVYLGTHLTTVVLGTVVLYLFLITTGRRRFRHLLYTTAIVTVVLLSALYLAAGNLRPTQALDLSLGYWLVLAGFGASTVIACMVLCWYCSQKTDHWILKLGLFTLGMGFALLAVPWMLTVGELITRDKAWDSSIDHIDGAAAACIAIGAILPVTNATGDAYRTLCAYGKLGHLWRDMTNTTPNVIFPYHSRIRRLLTVPGQLTLYRRVIEIRDAITILRNYTTPEVIQSAEQHVTQAGVPAGHHDAAITACWLAAAQHRRRQGHPAQAQMLASVSAGGDVIVRETDFLVQVANAYKSTLTTDFVHHLLVEPAHTLE
ncbi:MAG: MAB_1171c family putative transporter [Pseudonocardiaceae bacterium]